MSGKLFAFFCVFFIMGRGALANIALPVHEPPPSGDVFFTDRKPTALRLAHEKLLLDLTRREQGFSRARYTIRNTSNREISTDLLFITPYMQKVSVFIDSKAAGINLERIPGQKLPWKLTVPEGVRKDEIPAYRFHVVFAPGAETVVEVVFRIPAGYDNRDKDMGMSSGEAAHAHNWSIEAGSRAWYLYYLESAGTFTEGIQRLDVEILTPEKDELNVNIPLVHTKTDDGVKSYTGSFTGMPAPYIEARVKHKAVYSMIGFSMGGGLVTNYADYTEFMTQVMFDVYFSNHQLSAGVEGNPFGTGFKLPLMYTFILGERRHPYFAFIGDLRLSAGALFDLSPQSMVGFRISAGLRITLMILEIAYDFYPFDTEEGYIGRMTFLYKISL